MEEMNKNDFRLMEDPEPEDALKVGCLSAGGYILAFVVFFIICALFSNCKASKHVAAKQDSIFVQTRTEVVYVPDTTFIAIPTVVESKVIKDSASHLENAYAVSDARINSDGTLFHSLATKQKEIEIAFQKPVITKDSIRTKTIYETIEKKIEVVKPKTWWEQTKSYGFYVLVVLIIWRYRKQLLKVITVIFL